MKLFDKKFLNKHFNLDAFVLTSGRTITFISASIISAVINLFFIGRLSKDAAFLMIGISITLELSKLLHVTMYNTLNELARKLSGFGEAKEKMTKVAKRWLIGYLGYAIIAVIAAVFFSMMNLGREVSSVNTEIENNKRIYEISVQQEIELKNLTNDIKVLGEQLLDTSTADALFEQIENERSKARIIWQNAPIENVEGKKLQSWERYYAIKDTQKWQAWEAFVSSINAKYNKSFDYYPLQRRNKGISLFEKGWDREDIKKAVIVDIQANYKVKEAEKENKLNAYKSYLNKVLTEKEVETATIGYDGSSLIQLRLSNLNNSKINDAGSQGAFIIASNVLGVPEDVIRTILILILSLLVELTIYQTSPKIKISRKMMFQFTQYLPADFNINKFMDKVDKELIDYDIIKIASKDEKQIIKAEVEATKAEKKAKAEEANIKVKRTRKVKKAIDKESEQAVKREIIEEAKSVPVEESKKVVIEEVKKEQQKSVEVLNNFKKKPVETHTPTIDEKMAEIKAAKPENSGENIDTKMREIKERFTVPYKFGRTTEAVKNEFVKFIEELYNDAIKIDEFWLLKKPAEAAAITKIQKNNFDTFYEYLTSNYINGSKMIEERNGETLTTIDKKKLIDYVCEEIAA